MEEFDERFAAVFRDPRFHGIPRKERKVKVDKRFQAMFKDNKFKLKYSVDKRGRPLQQTSEENLKKFYEMPDSESEDGTNEDEEDTKDIIKDQKENVGNKSNVKPKKKARRSGREYFQTLLERRKLRQQGQVKENMRGELPLEDVENTRIDRVISLNGRGENYSHSEEDHSQESSPSDSEDGDSSESSVKPDYSRGEALMDSSSSDSESDEQPEFDMEHKWGEIDGDAQRSEEITRRLAICNMDWDRVKAQDIIVLLNSFKPTDGVICSVKIYPSDFGLQRMKEEDIKGPQELVEKDEVLESLEGKTEEKYHREKMRKYQIQRLKYFYAVVECDTPKTASVLYDQCDGFEYESSAVRLDLRFIPDDMTFDSEPRDVAEEIPDETTYTPADFTNTALQMSKVELTWDEDDQQRKKLTNQAFEDEDLDNLDIAAYLASSESEDNEQDQVSEKDEGSFDEGEDPNHTKESSLEKYRQLVRGLAHEDDSKNEEDLHMEITWEPGLKEATEEIVKKKTEVVNEKTPWQNYLEKKKEKKKQRREEIKRQKESNFQSEDGEANAFSDDEMPEGIDLQGSVFKNSLKSQDSKIDNKTRKKKKRHQENLTAEEKEAMKLEQVELELLMMDEDDSKQHFNLKSILKQEKTGKKKKNKKDEDQPAIPDTFEINVKDPRFEAVYTSHHYSIDPSDPQFKKTKGMEAVMEEKQKRRARGLVAPRTNSQYENQTVESSKLELSALVKSVKRKADQFNTKKGKRFKVQTD